MKLARKPRRPTSIPWILIKRDAQKEGWAKYLFWNLSIDERMEAEEYQAPPWPAT